MIKLCPIFRPRLKRLFHRRTPDAISFYVLHIMRFFILVGLVIRLVPIEPPILRVILIGYFLYAVLAAVASIRISDLYQVKPWIALHLIVDTTAFAAFYWYIGNAESDAFLLFFLPILLSTEQVRPRLRLVYFVVLSLVFFWLIATLPSPRHYLFIGKLVHIFVPRFIFLFLFLFLSSTRVDLLKQQRLRLTALDNELRALRELDIKINVWINDPNLIKLLSRELIAFFGVQGTYIRLQEGKWLRALPDNRDFTPFVEDIDLSISKDWDFVRKYELQQEHYVIDTKEDSYFQYLLEKSQFDGAASRILEEVKSYVCIPLTTGRESVGLLTVTSGIKNGFTEELINKIKEVSLRVSIAVKHSVQLQVERQEALEWRDGYRALTRIGNQDSLQKKLRELVNSVRTLLRVSSVAVFIPSKVEGEFVLAAANLNGKEVDQSISQKENGIIGRVVSTGQTEIENRCADSEMKLACFDDICTKIIAAPLFTKSAKEDLLGILCAFTDDPDHPDFSQEHDGNLLENFGFSVSLILAQTGELSRERQRQNAIMGLPRISIRELETDQDSPLTSFFLNVLYSLQRIVHFDSGSLQLLRNQDQYHTKFYEMYCEIVCATGFKNNDRILGMRFPMLEPQGGIPLNPNTYVIKNLKSLNIQNLRESEYAHIANVEGLEDIRALLAVPLVIGNNPLGMLALEREDIIRPFNSKDQKLVEDFAEEATLAIQEALNDERQGFYGAMIRQLYNASHMISGDFRLDENLQTIADQAYRLTLTGARTQGGFSHVILSIANYVKFVATHPIEKLDELEERSQRIIDLNAKVGRKGIIGRVVATGEDTLVNDLSEDTHYYQLFDSESVDGSQLSVPIKLGNRVIGVISVFHSERNRFTNQDKVDLGMLAIHAASIIRISHLLEARLGLRAMTMPIITQQHDIRQTKINIINSTNDLLESMHNVSGIAPGVELNRIHDRLTTILNEAKAIPEFDWTEGGMSTTSEQESVDVKDMIMSVLKTDFDTGHFPGLKIETDLHEGIRINCDPNWVRRALVNLISNAIFAMKSNSAEQGRKLHISSKKRNDGVEIEILGNGTKIPVDHLFDLYYGPVRQGERLSVGAFVASQIIDMYGGHVNVIHTTNNTTSVGVWLPMAGDS